ncbi:hypothetical protein G6O69_13120 [Pseudenhygromyxa sp. WMMC2535]|uniref:tetratricopeptide repeat protein n=1 Tax=Pseudenhygromyxa sp. WMMC2535 TaxID=2712867 RepID=UPI001553D633|nr:hypothetical protein [Pseudenhygromyxa sp. WMMC2535]NVB38775.1 hypothetical protein [Pseudenhygromyxa sp. WMMC2535]
MTKRTFSPWTAASISTAIVLTLSACPGKPSGHPSRQRSPAELTRRDLPLSVADERRLLELAEAAEQNPDDFAARRASGMAHMHLTLAGVLSLRERAEADLEAAFFLDSSDAELNRALGRFYNMRAVDGDYSKADMQVKVYGALLGERDPMAMDDLDFVAWSFFQLGRVLTDKNRGKNLRALAKVDDLEAILAARVKAQPDNIEFHALAGNFAFFFAGNIPLERERRVEEAVAYFEVLRARWDELRPGAKDPSHCPNTYENFMFELAEGYTVLGRADMARPIYEELARLESDRAPRTRAKELIAHVSGERLRNLDSYLGEMKLMPPWPSDIGNCVVCHAWNAEIPLDSLYALDPLRAEDVPSRAEPTPLSKLIGEAGGREGEGDEAGEAGEEGVTIAGREQLPEALAALVEDTCSPCHFPGGEVADLLDLSRAEAVIGAATWIDERVAAGEMPPGDGLDEDARARVHEWAAALTD